MANRYTRRQFFGIGALAGSSLLMAKALAAAPRPCWELPPTHPKWCPPPTPGLSGTRKLTLII